MQPAELPAPSDGKPYSPQESAAAPPPDEEERGPSIFSPSQVRNAQIIWPDVDLNRRTWYQRASALVEAVKAKGRALARGWSRD